MMVIRDNSVGLLCNQQGQKECQRQQRRVVGLLASCIFGLMNVISGAASAMT